MRRLLILISPLFLSCASPKLPKFPDIKDHWMVEIRNEQVFSPQKQLNPKQLEILDAVTNPEDIPTMQETEVARCLRFEIVSHIPYEIRFIKQEPMLECHLIGGYKPRDSLSLYNWLIDAKSVFEKYKHCFR